MSAEPTQDRVAQIIRQIHDVELNPNDPVAGTLDLDSLGLMELVIEFESEWPDSGDLLANDSPLFETGTVAQITEYIGAVIRTNRPPRGGPT